MLREVSLKTLGQTAKLLYGIIQLSYPNIDVINFRKITTIIWIQLLQKCTHAVCSETINLVHEKICFAAFVLQTLAAHYALPQN